MDFFETVNARRSVRKYTFEQVPTEVIEKAFEAAILAPNSSNVQAWDFYWVRSPEKKAQLVKACLSQSAARSAAELVVVVADLALWKRSNPELIRFATESKAPKAVQAYYKKLIPLMYTYGVFNSLAPFKWLLANIAGIFRPMPRGPNTKRDLQEVCIKSAALAAENFVLAIVAQGYGTCMMEGFDACRVHRLLDLSCSAKILMVISVGKAAENGIWGQRFRLSKSQVVHQI